MSYNRIIPLSKRNLIKIVDLYQWGLLNQRPKYKSKKEGILKNLKKLEGFIYKNHKGTIVGLITYNIKANKVIIDFVCSKARRKGIVTSLFIKLGKYCLKHNIKEILSRVSSKDKRTMNLYFKKFRFKKYYSKKTNLNFISYRVKIKPSELINFNK